MSSPLLSPIATASITAWIDGISTIGIFPLVCKTCPKEKIYATRIVALRLTGIPAFDDHVKDYLLQHSSRVNPDVTIVTVARVAAIFRSLSRPFCTLHALRIDDDRIARYCDKIFSNVLAMHRSQNQWRFDEVVRTIDFTSPLVSLTVIRKELRIIERIIDELQRMTMKSASSCCNFLIGDLRTLRCMLHVIETLYQIVIDVNFASDIDVATTQCEQDADACGNFIVGFFENYHFREYLAESVATIDNAMCMQVGASITDICDGVKPRVTNPTYGTYARCNPMHIIWEMFGSPHHIGHIIKIHGCS